MIQRIQSIYLLLVAAANFSLFALPFANSEKAIRSSALFADSTYNLQDNIALLILFALGGILALVTIFLFKNRKLQIQLGQGILVLLIIGLGLATFLWFNDGTMDKATLAVGMFTPLFGFVFTALAVRAIRKDEKLVRSADRLRD